MAIHLTEDEMADIKKEVLTKLRPYLCHTIKAERHFDYLRSRRIITRDDAEEMTCQPRQSQRTGTLLDILGDNPRGLDVLIESIQLSGCQNFIIAKITDEVQRAKNEKIEALRASASSINNLGVHRAPLSSPNDLSKSFSEGSTMLYHPDGEGSPCASILTGSLDLNSQKGGGGGGPLVAGWDVPPPSSSSSAAAASTLPRPGDPGAPALPEELLGEEMLSPPQSSASQAEDLKCSGGAELNFQPLRSRSASPMCAALPADQQKPTRFIL